MAPPLTASMTLSATPSTALRANPIVMVSSVQEDPSTLFPMAGEMPLITPDAYFSKPLEIPKFLETVRRMLGE